MRSLPLLLSVFLVAVAQSSGAQSVHATSASAVDTAVTLDDEGVRLGLQFGVTTGALAYRDGRSEQALGAIVRWAPAHWFAVSVTPTGVHAATPAVASTPATSQSGLVDMPITATLSHRFATPLEPELTGGFGFSVPVGNAAEGFGSGQLGTELELGAGLSPTDGSWISIGAGRSLSSVAVQSAFSTASGWGDLSGGVSVNERLSLSGGYETDLGPVDDPTIGRSRSLNAGVGFSLNGPSSVELNASHGMSGMAPRWSLAIGIGTAFPVLGHANAAPSLTRTFGNSGHSGVGRGHRP